LIASDEFSSKSNGTAMTWVQLVLVAAPPEKLMAPVGM